MDYMTSPISRIVPKGRVEITAAARELGLSAPTMYRRVKDGTISGATTVNNMTSIPVEEVARYREVLDRGEDGDRRRLRGARRLAMLKFDPDLRSRRSGGPDAQS